MKNKPIKQSAGRYKLKYRGVECLNCAHPLDISDKFCPNCSQANSLKKLSIKDFFEEFFSNIMSYDNRLFRTLIVLITRPGRITKEYIDGKRVSFTNPFRFLLSLAIIYFLLIGIENKFESLDRLALGNPLANLDLKKQLNDVEFDNEQEKQIAFAALDSLQLGNLIANTLSKKDSIILSDPTTYYKELEDKTFFSRYTSKIDFFKTLIKKDTVYSINNVTDKYTLPITQENRIAFNLSQSFLKIERRPSAFINDIFSKLPVTTFFFLPVFTLFISLAYIRKKYSYTDHLIFSFHNQSLLFILLIISYFVNALLNFGIEGIVLFIFLIYLYKAMRNFYQQGRFKTLIKLVLLNTIFFVLAGIAFIFLFIGSAFTY